jgi:outer membrane protein OmpA-like peptidoglycan-associated protein
MLLAGFCLAAAPLSPITGPALAQPMPVYSYPGSGQPLLQPGEKPSDQGPIILHLPSRKPAARTARPARVAAKPAAEPQPEPKTAAAPSSGYSGAYPGFGLPPSTPPAPAPKPAPQPKPVAPPQLAPPQVAKAEPPKPTATPPAADSLAPGLTKRSVILFAAGASDPAQSALGAIKYLAGDLTSAMTGPSARIQLQAYGGARGDKGSDARRLSLKRALAIRQVLIDDGVPADRIDVHAAGGADDNGPADRVDVYIKA